MENRYDRQQRIENWDQERLSRAKISIVGTGQLAQFTAASLAALGIGNITLYDANETNTNGFLESLGNGEESNLEGILHAINPDTKVNVLGLTESPDFGDQDLVLDLTNSPDIKSRTLEYAQSQKVNAISASVGKTGGELCFIKTGEASQENPDYSSQNQGGFSSMIFGGMITEEARKAIMPIRKEEQPVKSLGYQATADKRFTKTPDFEECPYEDLSQKRILIVGAGALGNFVALGAALEGIGKIDILDFDEVEPHNLNRQLLFYDAVGKKKAQALAEKIRKINPNIEVRSLVEKLDEKTTYFSDNKPDLVLDCVDNFATRAITNYFAVHNQVPLVSGGTNSSSGQVVVYEPRQTACLECKLGVERALGIALQGSKCTDQPNPSVIMTNEIIGGMMIGEALKVLDKGYGAPSQRIIKYDSDVAVRGGLVGASNTCACSKDEDITKWLSELKQRYSLQE